MTPSSPSEHPREYLPATSPARGEKARSPLQPAWWIHGPGLAFALLLLIFVGGTLGYVVIEGWTVWDAFYMTMITVTTVGYGEVHPLSRGGQVFTVFVLGLGLGTALYAFSFTASAILEGGLQARWARRRRERMIDDLDRHFIICGYGRIGSIIVDEFRRQRVPHIVIERDSERVHNIIESGGLAVEADASREEVLTRVGIARARGLIAAVGTDAENVYTVLSARLMRPDLFIIGRAETDDSRRKLLRAGADRVISPYQIGALQMAQTALRPAVVDFVQLATSSDNLDLMMEQVKIDGSASLANRSIVEANLRQRFGVVVIGIQRPDGRMEFNPPPDAVMQPGDSLVVLGHADSLRELEAAAQARA
ncbi:MAG: potassium channel protein [Acidobacteria bacterium]|nr:potassium channel protein [Acidobacteriota bacterium]